MKCLGYRDSRDYDSIVCARCCRFSHSIYVECLKLTQERKVKANKMYEDSRVSLVLFDERNNVLKDVKLTRKQLQEIRKIV